MPTFANFAEAEKALEPFLPARLGRPAYTTEYIARFLEHIGNPQDKSRAIHIAGTSGKTSTAYYAAALLTAAGKRVGLLTSPHIERINERVQIDMVPLEEAVFCKRLAEFLKLVEKSGIVLSHAELLYSFAFWGFAKQEVDFIVVEVGMGGRLDATNVMHRPDKVCVITDIGLDHVTTLGPGIKEVAAHKAGIIQAHNAVFCYRQSEEVLSVLRQAAADKRAALHILDDKQGGGNQYSDEATTVHLPLFQKRNFRLALKAVEALGIHFDSTQIKKASETYIPGRMEQFSYHGKNIILDGAHNVQKLQMLRKSLTIAEVARPIAALAAFTDTRSRDIQSMLAELWPIISHLIITTLPDSGGRSGRSPEEIAKACQALGIKSYTVIDDTKDSVQALLGRPEPTLLITGSIYLLRSIRPYFRPAKTK